MPIFHVKSVKIYTGKKNLHWRRQWRQWQISGMSESEEEGREYSSESEESNQG